MAREVVVLVASWRVSVFFSDSALDNFVLDSSSSIVSLLMVAVRAVVDFLLTMVALARSEMALMISWCAISVVLLS